MNYKDIREARDQAEQDISRADQAVRDAVRLIKGRLKSSRCSGSHLEELKRELRDFNMRDWTWKQ